MDEVFSTSAVMDDNFSSLHSLTMALDVGMSSVLSSTMDVRCACDVNEVC